MHPHPTLRRVSPLIALAAGLSLNAQATPPPAPTPATPTLTVNAQLVNLPVIVRDKNGALITTLTQSDFALALALAVDGHPQPIRYFDRDNNLPLTLGLLVDISGSVRSALEDERTASEAFLDQMVTAPAGRLPDQAFLIEFAHEADLLQSLTPSVPKLRAALSQVGVEDRNDSQSSGNSGGYGGHGRHGGFHGGGTTLYDAIFLASSDLMQKQQGRKAVIVLTDGEDRGSMETMASAIAAAQRAETVVYAIYFKGEQHPSGGYGHGGFGGRGGFPGGGGYPGGGGGRREEQHVDGRKVLAQITGETGGRMFEVKGKQTFAAIYSQIGDELRSQYRLGYVPNADAASAGFHRVDLTLTKDKKLYIQTRNGYYAGQ